MVRPGGNGVVASAARSSAHENRHRRSGNLDILERDVLDPAAVHAFDDQRCDAAAGRIQLVAHMLRPVRAALPAAVGPRLVADQEIAARRQRLAVDESDLAHRTVRSRSELVGVAVAAGGAVGDEDVFDDETSIVGLEHESVVRGIDVARIENGVGRLYIEAVVVVVAVVVDAHAPRRYAVDAFEYAPPAGGVAQQKILEPHVFRVGEENSPRAQTFLVGVGIARHRPRAAVAEYFAFAGDRHVGDSDAGDDRAPSPFRARKRPGAVVLKPVGAFQDRPLLEMDLDVRFEDKPSGRMAPGGNRNPAAALRRRRVDRRLPFRRLQSRRRLEGVHPESANLRNDRLAAESSNRIAALAEIGVERDSEAVGSRSRRHRDGTCANTVDLNLKARHLGRRTREHQPAEAVRLAHDVELAAELRGAVDME